VNAAGAVRGFALFVLLLALHYSLRPLLGWRAGIDFLVIAVLVSAVRVRPGAAALIGLFTGFVADSLAPGMFGAAALSMAAVAFGASWLKAVFFTDSLALTAFFLFLGKWVFDALLVITQQSMGARDGMFQLILWSPLAAAATAGAGVVILVLLRPFLEPTRA
jgi:rod shape-determining protein MreD